MFHIFALANQISLFRPLPFPRPTVLVVEKMNPREEIYLWPVLATSASANAFEGEIVSRGEQVVSCNRQILQNSSQLQLPLDLWKMILSDHDPIREVKFFSKQVTLHHGILTANSRRRSFLWNYKLSTSLSAEETINQGRKAQSFSHQCSSLNLSPGKQELKSSFIFEPFWW